MARWSSSITAAPAPRCRSNRSTARPPSAGSGDDVLAGRVRGLEQGRGTQRGERGCRCRSARRSPGRRTLPRDGLVRRWASRARVRGAAARPSPRRRDDRRGGAVRRARAGLDGGDGGEQPDRVPARRARPRPAAPLDAAARGGSRRRGTGGDRDRAPERDLRGRRGRGERCARRADGDVVPPSVSLQGRGDGSTTISRSSGRGGSSSRRSACRSRCGRDGRT
jgi:hypothetical protein